ncbi:hypothetical protein ORC19_001060 [Escherichia coli]|nr:hypothetical protein [Escherichia coli]
MGNKNEVFEYLIDQLRQQVNNNQCEDLAHEVQSLKNRLRDASAQIKELHLALVKATGDAEAYKLIRKQEQSGCREEDGRECDHDWYFYDKGASMMCKKCGVRKECEHEWQFYGVGFPCMCIKCGLKK